MQGAFGETIAILVCGLSRMCIVSLQFMAKQGTTALWLWATTNQEGGDVKMKTKPVAARKPRLALVISKVRDVRTERGRKAHGDLLLKSALRSLRQNHLRSAIADLERFLQFVPDVSPTHRAICQDACTTLSDQGYDCWMVMRCLLRIFDWCVAVMQWLKGGDPMNCQRRPACA